MRKVVRFSDPSIVSKRGLVGYKGLISLFSGNCVFSKNFLEVEDEVTLRLTVGRSVGQSVSRSVCLGIEHLCWTCDQILFPVGMLLSEICGFVSVGRALWREDGFIVYIAITEWSESLITRNHTLLSEISPTWRARFQYLYPPVTGWPSYNPGHWVRTSCVSAEVTLHVVTSVVASKMYLIHSSVAWGRHMQLCLGNSVLVTATNIQSSSFQSSALHKTCHHKLNPVCVFIILHVASPVAYVYTGRIFGRAMTSTLDPIIIPYEIFKSQICMNIGLHQVE
jgi:hypothetical protein